MPDSAQPLTDIPIVLGVVGHRLLPADRDTLVAALDRVFDEFDKAYPHSPKVLLSSLAPGGDALAAERALRRDKWTVRSPLPFPPAVYEQSSSFHPTPPTNPVTFDTAAQQRYCQWLADPKVEWFTVPLPDELPVADRTARRTDAGWEFVAASGPPTPVDWFQVAAEGAGLAAHERELSQACYANAGGYIVRHCHTLLALWDEKGSKQTSGTHEMVRFQLGGVAPTYYPWTRHEPLGFDADRGPVIVLPCPRDGGAVGKRRVLLPERSTPQTYGTEADVPRVARRLNRLQRLWGRVKETAGLVPPGEGVASVGLFGRLWRVFAWTIPCWLGRRLVHRHYPRPLRFLGDFGNWLVRGDYPEYAQFLAVCQAIDDFNRDAQAIDGNEVVQHKTLGQQLEQKERDANQTFPPADPDAAAPHRTPLRDTFHRIAAVQAVADHLAGGWIDRRWRWNSKFLFVLLSVTAAVFHLYVHPPHAISDESHASLPGLLVFFVALWVVMLGYVLWCWFKRWETRRLDYRALAEGLRVRAAWAIGGVGQSVSDSYLPQVRSELVWVRRAMQHLCPPHVFWSDQFARLDSHRQAERLEQVRRSWLVDQLRFHGGPTGGGGARHRHHHTAVTLRRRGFMLAFLGWLMYATVAGWWVLARAGLTIPPGAEAREWVDPAQLNPWLLLAGSMLFVFGGLVVAYCDRRGYEPLARQSDHLLADFRSGLRELVVLLDPSRLVALRAIQPGDNPPPSDDQAAIPPELLNPTPDGILLAQKVLAALGQEALHENAEWLMLHRSKPLELALGG